MCYDTIKGDMSNYHDCVYYAGLKGLLTVSRDAKQVITWCTKLVRTVLQTPLILEETVLTRNFMYSLGIVGLL